MRNDKIIQLCTHFPIRLEITPLKNNVEYLRSLEIYLKPVRLIW